MNQKILEGALKGARKWSRMAAKQRRARIAEYEKNPRICKQCKKPILVKKGRLLSDVLRYEYCSRSCWISRRNKIISPNRTKGELIAGNLYRKSGGIKWQYAWRSQISKNAQVVYKDAGCPRLCVVCGYDRKFEVAHIRPVADFPLEAKRGEINDPNNLVALCPTHHDELDDGFLRPEIVRQLKQGRELAAQRGLILTQQANSVN